MTPQMRKDQGKPIAGTKEDGAKLWQIATKDVTRLHEEQPAALPAKTISSRKKIPVLQKERPVSALPPSVPPRKSPAQNDRSLENRLRKGVSEIEGKIDLHGNTLNEAHKRLTSFIKRSYGAGKRYLLVVTGKGRNGGGAIRNEFRLWLETDEMRGFIFSISEAEIRHGGAGAFYVILKKNKS